MTSDAFNHIAANIHLDLVEAMPDIYPELKMQWDRMGGTTMPPSPLVDQYAITSEYNPYTIINGKLQMDRKLLYKVEVAWAKHVGTLAKLVDPQQIWHRSRDVAVAVDVLRINEMEHRLNQAREWYTEYKRYALSDRLSHEVSQIIREETRRALRLNYEWILQYIREHQTSSLGGMGYKWRNALIISRNEWSQILDMLKTNTEIMDEHPNYYVANRPRSGERSRANQIQQILSKYSGLINRTRIILFGIYMSLWTVFIPDKAAWYISVLEKVIDAINPEGEYYYPYVEGGKIYRRFSDLHQTGLPYSAYDAKAWDTGVGIIMGQWINCYLCPMGGIPQLPSGESHTSMIGTVGATCATRKLPGIKVILGDDIAYFGTSAMSTPWLEKDPMDTRFKFNLGVSYWHDPMAPRITGFKLTKDRSKDMKNLPTQEFTEHTAVFGSTRQMQQRALHAGLYLGRFGPGTLLEQIEQIPPGDFMSPSELLESIVETGAEDAMQWAEERGVKEVFM